MLKLRLRLGFTLIEIAVAVAILALLAAASYPGMASYRDHRRVEQSAVVMHGLVRIMTSYDTVTANGGNPPTNGRYPRSLFQLMNQITATQTTNCTSCRNSCNTAYTSTNVTGWNNFGPFFNREVVAGTGLRIPIGLLRDSLIRIPATAANASRSFARLQMRIDSVFYEDAITLNRWVDGGATTPTSRDASFVDTVGTVRWSDPVDFDDMIPSIFWNFPVGGC